MSSAPVAAPGRERFGLIHGLGGASALLVVWSHLSGFWLLTTGRTSQLHDARHRFVVAPFHLHQNGGHLGVVLFFFLLVFMETGQPGYLVVPGGWKGIEPLVAYVGALLLFLALMRWSPARLLVPFSFLGDISYSLYLLHLPVGIITLNLLAERSVPESASVVAAVAASLGFAWLSYRWVERPSQVLARRLSAVSIGPDAEKGKQ